MKWLERRKNCKDDQYSGKFSKEEVIEQSENCQSRLLEGAMMPKLMA